VFKARKQANSRKKIAYVFYFLAALNAIVKLTGIWPLDTSGAVNETEVMAIKLSFYFLPIVLFAIGGTFNILSRVKALQAEAHNMRGSSWQR
jgi:hypothetical protein